MTTFTTIRRTVLAALLGTLCATTAALAQEVSWANPGALGAGQRATLDLVFDETAPKGALHLPTIDGLSVVGKPSESNRMAIVNGQRSTSVTFSYPVRAEREGRIEIPAFDVNTTDGPLTVPAMPVEIGPAMLSGQGRHAGTPVDEAVSARLLPSTKEPYAGEVFTVDAVVGLRDGRRGEVVGTPEWTNPGVETEGWSKGQPTSSAAGSSVRFRTRAVATQPGTIRLAPAQQAVRIESGRSRDVDDFFSLPDFALPKFSMPNFALPDLADFFSRSNMSEVTVSTDPVELHVRPLPQPAPAGFSGAVGDFTLETKIVPQHPKAGEPVTWTLTLKGTGNWDHVQLPARAIPSAMRTLQPQQHREFKEDDRFSGSISEDLVLIPSRATELQLQPVRFVYFNPQTQQYETASVEPPVLNVAPGAAPQPQQLNASQAAAAAPVAPPAPAAAALPHDPLVGTGQAWSPLTTGLVIALCGVPFGALALYWLFLAVRRARQTDPRSRQRAAFVQLRAAIARAQGATQREERAAALLEWQQAATVVLDIPVAAPTAAQVRAVRDDAWFDVWAATEQALYSREATLDSWWYDKASALSARVRVPRPNPLRALQPRNLLPFTAATALLIACALAVHAEPLDEYRQGNFTAAQQQFASRAATAPHDWVARYNLGLTAAQLGENGRALGETAAAFVLHPQSEAVRWNLRIFAAHVSGVDTALVHVAFAPGVAAIARFASPATWQALLIAACVVLCVGALLALHGRYLGRARVRAAYALLGSGAIGLLVTILALQEYGTLANPAAAVVAQATALRSVPTEAESARQQTPAAAGSVVVMQKEFLGWVKVAQSSGQTGWLRRNDLVPLYAGTA